MYRWNLCMRMILLFALSGVVQPIPGFASLNCSALFKPASEAYFKVLQWRHYENFDWDLFDASLERLRSGVELEESKEGIEAQFALLAHFQETSAPSLIRGTRPVKELLQSGSWKVRYKTYRLLGGSGFNPFEIANDLFTDQSKKVVRGLTRSQRERVIENLFLASRLQDRIDLVHELGSSASERLREKTLQYFQKKLLEKGLHESLESAGLGLPRSARDQLDRFLGSEEFSIVFSIATHLQILHGYLGVAPKLDFVRLSKSDIMKLYQGGLTQSWSEPFWDELVVKYGRRISRQEIYSRFSKAYLLAGTVVGSVMIYSEIQEAQAEAAIEERKRAEVMLEQLKEQNRVLDEEIRRRKATSHLSPGERLFQRWKDDYRDRTGKEPDPQSDEYLRKKKFYLQE